MPLEGLWWAEDMTSFSTDNKDDWLWTAMIMQPDVVTKEIYDEAVEQVRAKKSPPSIDKIRFETYDEGWAAQVLHVGPYATEGPTIRQLHDFLEHQGSMLTDTTKHHHEIYLSDPRRTVPQKLKTIIRQPL
ncbi:MAG: GyrI-like domain-containing protein [Candidatus Saccharibacteria bacterium]